MSIIKPLPSWAIINRFPAFYEGESLTALEQTARVYAKINELINTYNRFVTENNAELTELEAQVQKDLACAIRTIINLTDSYITQVEVRLTHQDRKLDEQYKALTNDIEVTIDDVIQQMKEAGELDVLILNAIDALNNKFTALQTGVAEEQAALKADYESVKDTLEADYEKSKSDLEATYEGKINDIRRESYEAVQRVENSANDVRTQFEQDVSSNNDFRENTSVVIYQAQEIGGAIAPIVGQTVERIDKYSVVGVWSLPDCYTICKVKKSSTGTYILHGVGGGTIGTDPLKFTLYFTDITISKESVVVDAKCGFAWIGEGGNTCGSADVVIRIDGLVLNSGGIN